MTHSATSNTPSTLLTALLALGGAWLPMLVSGTGCGTACNDAYYFPGALLTLQHEDERPLDDGEYDLRVTVEGEAAELSFRKQGQALTCAEAEGCSVQESLGENVELTAEVYESEIVLRVSNKQGGGGPARIDVELTRDGTAVLDEQVEPAYTEDEPNGKGCGVTVRASEVLVLD